MHSKMYSPSYYICHAKTLKKFFADIFTPIGLNIVIDSKNYKEYVLERERLYLEQLHKQKEEHDISKIRNNYGSNNIHLTHENLQKTIALAVPLVRNFMEQRYFKVLYKETRDNFWPSFQLEDNDFINLARKLLVEIFGDRFLIPLEKEDLDFSLDIKHVNIEQYFKMLSTNTIRDDLDQSDIISVPQTNIVARIDCIRTPYNGYSDYKGIERCTEHRRYNFSDPDHILLVAEY